MNSSRYIVPFRITEVATESSFWGKANGMHDAIDARYMLTESIWEGSQILFIFYSKLNHRGRLRKAIRDSLGDAHRATEGAKYDSRTLFLSKASDMKGDGCLSEDSCYKNILTFEERH
jgi:hypothetical protein